MLHSWKFVEFCAQHLAALCKGHHVFILVCISLQQLQVLANRCSREPLPATSDRTLGDGGFRLTVDEQNVYQYIPDHLHKITIATSSPQVTLRNFLLVAVPIRSLVENVTVGEFWLFDNNEAFLHPECSHIVTGMENFPRNKVNLLWMSPPSGSGCVEFRATVMVSEDIWYKDDGALTKALCQQQVGSVANVSAADVLLPLTGCCACGTAKYQMTFHGLWSHRTHPKQFPDRQTSLLHWSPVIGSSHSKHYKMWNFGSLASRGVGDTCEYGDTRALEDEIRHHSSNIRTVIKTPGIQWTEEHGLQQQRWAHFSVDRKHHLLSFLSRLSPSPDWCVGVSALDLCLANCTWLSEATVELFAWDAGVSDGVSYMSEKQRSEPIQPIHRLTDSSTRPSSPFYGSESIKPMAVLQVHRFDPTADEDVTAACERPSANIQQSNKERNEETSGDNPPTQTLCALSSWSDWTPCSTVCGSGVRTKSRMVLSNGDLCENFELTMSEPCTSMANCTGKCQLSEWSAWSTCSNGYTACTPDSHGIGRQSCTRRRYRFYHTPGVETFCSETTEQLEECTTSSTDNHHEFDSSIWQYCYFPADGGPCDGNFPRWYYDPNLRRCSSFLYGGCRGNGNRFRTEADCLRRCSFDSRQLEVTKSNGAVHVSDAATTTNGMTVSGTSGVDFNPGGTSTISPVVDCIMSLWSAWSSCSVSCGRGGFRSRFREVIQPQSAGGRKCPKRRRRQRRCRLPACESEHCRYGSWSTWSPCAKTCGDDTVQERVQRAITTRRGRSRRLLCPVKLQRRLCTLPPCVYQ